MGLVGMPVGDVLAEYRAHAAMVADGERPRPVRALLMEFDATGFPRVYQFGQVFDSNRDAIAALLGSIAALNAKAGN